MPQAITPAMVSPNGFWIRTQFYRDGDMLKARSFMVVAGDPVVFEVGVNLRILEAAVAKYHKKLEDDLHRVPDGKTAVSGDDCIGCEDAEIGSIFGKIGRAVKSIGRSKIVKAVAKTAKRIVKSKVVGTMSAGLAVAFPPVGLPAAAAYASANAALAAIDRGNAVRKAAASAVSKSKAPARAAAKARVSINRTKAQVALASKAKTIAAQARARALAAAKSKNLSAKAKAQAAAKSRAANAARAAAVARAKASALSAKRVVSQARAIAARPKPKISIPSKTKLALAKAVALEKKARTTIQTLANTAQYSTDLTKKAQAQRMMGILSVAAKARAATKNIPATAARTSTTARALASKPTAVATGLVVTERGGIIKGKFNEVSAGKIRGKLYRRGRSLPGKFTQIGCSNPWPNVY